jgi:DNA-binding NarL/FixJ family response regulator
LSAERPRAVLVEEQPALRTAVRKLLEEDGFVVCAEAADAEEGLRAVSSERPDVCLVGLPLGDETLRMIAAVTDERHGAGCAAIVLTASHSPESMIEAIRAGAGGYLLKGMNPERLPPAVRGVLGGEAAVPRTLAVRLIEEVRRVGRGPMLWTEKGLVELTPRQWEVLNLMADRLTTEQIAERLTISPVTVRRHVSALLGRLRVRDRGAAIALLRSGG